MMIIVCFVRKDEYHNTFTYYLWKIKHSKKSIMQHWKKNTYCRILTQEQCKFYFNFNSTAHFIIFHSIFTWSHKVGEGQLDVNSIFCPTPHILAH